VYASTDARAALSALAAGGATVHPVFAEPEGALALEVPTDCDAITVECSPQLLAHLDTLRDLADALVLPLLGLARVSPEPAFSESCDALLWLEGNTVVEQLTEHLRWHARLHTTARSPEKTRAQRRLNFFKPYAEFFRNSADGMVVVSYSGDVLYANPVAKAFAAQHSAPPGGTSVIDFLQASDRRRAAMLTKALQAGQSPMSSDFAVTTTSGAHVLSVSASVISKNAKAILLTFRDVTSQRETERALTHTKDFLERVIDSSVDAIVSADLKGNILVFNRAASRIFGYPPGTVIGRLNVRDLYPQGGAQTVMRRIRSPEDGGSGRLEGYETFMIDRQGQTIPVRLSAALVREDGRPVATVGVFTDIRQELAMRERLTQAETDLREKEKGVALAELAGMTAHELNQPLTCVLSYSELLQRKCTQPDVITAASVIIGQAQRMAEIVKRIGRITRYETKTYVGGASILDLDKAAHKNGDGLK
jgi:PAS domain S-box-containing protein